MSIHTQIYVYRETNTHTYKVFPSGAVVKNPPANAGDARLTLGWKDPLEGMATHSSNLAWEIPWAEEPGGLQSIGSQRIGHD